MQVQARNPKLASSSAGTIQPLIFHDLVRILHALLASSTRLKFYREHQRVLKTRCPRRLCLNMYGGNLKVYMVVSVDEGTRKWTSKYYYSPYYRGPHKGTFYCGKSQAGNSKPYNMYIYIYISLYHISCRGYNPSTGTPTLSLLWESSLGSEGGLSASKGRRQHLEVSAVCLFVCLFGAQGLGFRVDEI